MPIVEICTDAGVIGHRTGKNDIPILDRLTDFCEEKRRARPFSLTLEAGAYPNPISGALGTPFEKFNQSWQSTTIDPEVGREWSEMPSIVKTELSYPVSEHSFVHFRLGLHRDLAAWHQDPLGHNIPLSASEVDLNEPSLGYFHAENGWYAVTVGRFKVHWSPSPDFGLALSQSVPYHNAAEFALKMPRARYRFLVSSLNPWLAGTPSGDTSGTDYPVGSEEYRQRHYSSHHGAGIFHNRVWDADIKTLFAHRLEGDIGPLGLGITEAQIIGGKPPDLRDAGPFVIFHNDFKDGYTNSALSFDAALRLPAGFSLAGELYLDDAEYADTEGEGNTPSLMGYIASIRHGFTLQGWAFTHSIHFIRTDPFLYGYQQPLNTMANRHILATNHDDLDGPVLTDRLVMDYPMGYVRGGDALDFWYKLEAWNGPSIHYALEAALISRGEVGLQTPYETYYSSGHDSPTGTVEREIRLRLGGDYRFRRDLSANAGITWQDVWNWGHVAGADSRRFRVSAGVAWVFAPIP